MYHEHELVMVYLELAAAKAKQLAEDYKRARLCPRELQQGIGEISEALNKASNLARDDR